jgi:hypothetical protein
MNQYRYYLVLSCTAGSVLAVLSAECCHGCPVFPWLSCLTHLYPFLTVLILLPNHGFFITDCYEPMTNLGSLDLTWHASCPVLAFQALLVLRGHCMSTVRGCSGLRCWLSQETMRKGFARDSRVFLGGWP